MPTLTITIPDHMEKHIDVLINNGFAQNRDILLNEAISRYIDSHNDEIIKQQILRDVNWGLED